MSSENKAKLIKLKKYVPILDAWLNRLRRKKKNDYYSKIEKLRQLLTNEDTKMSLESLTKCELLLANLENELGGIEDQDEKPKENMSLDSSRAKLRSFVTKPELKDEKHPNNSETSRPVKTLLFARRSQIDEASSSNTESPVMRQFTRVFSKFADRFGNHENSPLYERRPPREERCTILPRYRQSSSSSLSDDSRKYNENLDIDHDSFNLCKADDVVERFFYGKDAIKKDACAKICDQLKDIVPKDEIPNLLKVKVEVEGEITGSDVEIEALDCKLHVDFDNKDLNNYHENRSFKPHRPKIKVNTVLAKPKIEFTNSVEKTSDSGAIDKYSEKAPNKQEESVSQMSTTMQKQVVEIRDEKSLNLIKNDVSKNDVMISNKTDKKVKELNNEVNKQNKDEIQINDKADGSTKINKILKQDNKSSEQIKCTEFYETKTNERNSEKKTGRINKNEDHNSDKKENTHEKKSDQHKNVKKKQKSVDVSQTDKENIKKEDPGYKKHSSKYKEGSNSKTEAVSEKNHTSQSSDHRKKSVKPFSLLESSKKSSKLSDLIESMTPHKKENLKSNSRSSDKSQIFRSKDSHRHSHKSDPGKAKSINQSTIFDAEEKKLRKILTAKEFQRFQPFISDTIKENLRDPETQSKSRDMSLSPIPATPQTPLVADSCPKSPEHTDHLTEFKAPKTIPSEPVKNVLSPRPDVDLRKIFDKINSNQSSLIASTPTISDNLSPLFSSHQERQPLPNHLNPKNITYRTYDTTPTDNPFESKEQKRFGFRSNSFQDRNRVPVWKNSQSFAAFESNRLPNVRKTVYVPQLDLSSPFDRGITSVWDRSPWDRSRTYDNDRSSQKYDSTFRKGDSSRYNEFDGRNQSRNVCNTANPYFQGSNVVDHYRASLMEKMRENRNREFGSDPKQKNSRWTQIDSQQRSLNKRDPRLLIASYSPVDANIRNISTFNRYSGDNNKDAGIYNREKGYYSRDAWNYRSEPRNYNYNRENYTIPDPLTFSSSDTLKHSGSYSQNIERVNTRLSSERDNIRSTSTYASNANQNFHSHYTVIDPRRGRQFYNAEKVLTNRATNKPNPGYIRENRYDKNANIDYIKKWEPKHIERKSEIDQRFQRAQSVGRELSSESKSCDGGAVSKTKKYAKVWENVENVIISLRPNFSRSKSVGSKSSRNNARNVKRKTSSSHADRVRNFRELKSQNKSNYNKNPRSRSYDYKSSQSNKHAVTAPPVRGKWFDKLAKYDKKYASKDSKDHWSSKNSNDDRHSSLYKHHTKNNRVSSSERNHMKKSYVSDKRWGRSISLKKQQGIVYLNDNIAKGKAITPSFGVKNDKIPKIKKVEPMKAKKTPSVKVESAIQVKTSDLDKNKTPNKLFDSKEKKNSNVKNTQKPMLQNTSERKSEIKVQEKSLSNQEKYPSSNKSNATNQSSINMNIADKELISEPVKMSNDSIQKLLDDAKLQSNKTLIPSANKQSAAFNSPKSVDENETELVLQSASEKSNETKTYASTEKGKDTTRSSLATLRENKEVNYSPLKELQVSDENSFDSYSAIAGKKLKLKLCEIEDSLNNSLNKDEIIIVDQQSVQPAASIKKATSNQDFVSNKNLLTSDNDTERGQTTATELGSEVRKDELESKSTQNASNIQDEKAISSSSKDYEIEDILCKGLIEPKNYESNYQILEENALDSTENSQEKTLPQSETGINETICDIIENDSEPKKSVTKESNKVSNVNTPIIDSSKSVSKAIDVTSMPEKRSQTENKHETCKKKSGHVQELAYLHENLKENVRTSMFSGTRTCRLTNKANYRENTEKIHENVTDYVRTSIFSGTRTCRLTNKANYSENTEKNDNLEKYKGLDAFKQKKTVTVVPRKPGPKPRINLEKTESFEVKMNEKMDTRSMKKKMKWKDLISAQNSKKVSSPPMPRDSYKIKDSVDKSMETLCSSGQRENDTSHLFTDLQYHFKQNEATYSCKLCNYVGDEIVYHYKNSHPDHEVAISRLSSKIAVAARQQRDFEIIMDSNQKHRNQICRFCSLEFTNLPTLKTLFWHIVSKHTGEYQRSGTDKNIVLPSPPTDDDNLLLGYMCGHCFYTQLCFENVSDHAVRHHQREETKVFTICLSEVDFKKSPVLQKKSARIKTETSTEKIKIDQHDKVPDDDEVVSRQKVPRLVQKITFEDSEQSDIDHDISNDEQESDASSSDHEENDQIEEPELVKETAEDTEQMEDSDCSDETIEKKSPVVFELDFKNDGSKIYLCKIESCEFNTTLQISFKKHVQIRHATVLWDGVCQFCDFKSDSCSYANYANHFVIEHLEPLNFQEKENDEGISKNLHPIQSLKEQDKTSSPNKCNIQMRPLPEVLQTPRTTSIDQPNNDSELSSPVIQSVVHSQDGSILKMHEVNDDHDSLVRRLLPKIEAAPEYACPIDGCEVSNPIATLFEKHLNESHPNTRSYRCKECVEADERFGVIYMNPKQLITHLKSHGYHDQKHLVEKHVSEKHGGRASVLTAREPFLAPLNSVPQSLPSRVPTPSTPSAPTMDLKKWKCGFCEYSNLLRLDVFQHISETHQLNNRYRCSICPYSNILKENVESHLSFEHNGVECVVLIVYYQEGTVEEMKAGKKLWMYQKEIIEKCRSQIKAEMNAQNPATSSESQDNEGALQIDLGHIKQEDTATAGPCQLTTDEAALFLYGQPGEPDGLKFLCPICRLYSSVETKLFSDHLYVELGYRSWRCEICTYRGLTESQLNDHLSAEHSGWRKSGSKFNHIKNPNIEAWISLVIRTQQQLINKNSRDLSKSNRWLELQEKFGPSCQPKNGLFACPRCTMQSEDRALIEDHLMRELEIFSWSCSVCTRMFHYYQNAKEHASSHANVPCPISRVPVEWQKEWIQFAVEYQVDIMRKAKKAAEPEIDIEGSSDNELLVVRREDKSTTVPDAPASCSLGADGTFYCPFCSYKSPSIPAMKRHAAPHLGVKPYRCTNCAFMARGAKAVRDHVSKQHRHDDTAQCRMTCSEDLLHFPDRNAAHPGVTLAAFKSVEPPKKKMKLSNTTARKSTTKLLTCATARKSTTRLAYNTAGENL